jgi:omega-6 fatty acid desaturase (delta-12 desaturase)
MPPAAGTDAHRPATTQARSDRRDLRTVALRFQAALPRAALSQIATTFPPLLALLAAMHVGLRLGWWPVFVLALPAAGFVVRVFALQHDCGHGSLFRSRRTKDAVGRFSSLFTLTPYSHWRRQHAAHHAVWNDLDHRDRGADIYSTCTTVAEFKALGRWRRLAFCAVRHPLVAQLLPPPLVFLVLYRIPFYAPPAWRRERRGVLLTNAALAAAYGGLCMMLGFWPVVSVLLGVMVPASIAGVWLFSVQHRFEGVRWIRHATWDPVTASLEGSSYLRLPPILRWFTGRLGFHHVHHLAPRIPNYRLEDCHNAHPAFAGVHVVTLRDAFSAPRYVLWDDAAGRMVTLAEADQAERLRRTGPGRARKDYPGLLRTALLPSPGQRGRDDPRRPCFVFPRHPERGPRHMPDVTGAVADALAELQRRTRQQAMIAEFGRFALRENSMAALMQEAARLAADGLGAAFAKVLEHEPAGDTLVVRAGIGWRPGVVEHVRFPPGATSPAGYAFATGAPTFSNDLAADHRFGLPPLLADHSVRREVNVVVRGDGPPFGVLEVDDTADGAFSADDVHFLEALANTLGLALERGRVGAERERLLDERGNLLAEVHHRVKNSLQLVHTVLTLQVHEADASSRKLLELSAMRVMTIAAVHERLYQGDRFDAVEMHGYLLGLIEALRAGLAELTPGKSVSLEAEVGAYWPPKRAQALGLVLAELVTNALKYGSGEVRVRFTAATSRAEARLEVEDEGPGLPPDFDMTRQGGLGLRIAMTLLREQGGALMAVAGTAGARFVAEFPEPVPVVT